MKKLFKHAQIKIIYLLGFLLIPVLFIMSVTKAQKSVFRNALVGIKFDIKSHNRYYKNYMKSLDYL